MKEMPIQSCDECGGACSEGQIGLCDECQSHPITRAVREHEGDYLAAVEALEDSHERLKYAIGEAARLIATARRYFPKPMHNADKYQLENVCATLNRAVHEARRV